MTTSGAEDLAQLRLAARWVACFNTSSSQSFAGVFAHKQETPRRHMLVYGADAGAKDIARALIRNIGFEPFLAGGLCAARFAQSFREG